MLHNQEPKLKNLNRPGHPDGMTVPEGYFEQFAEKMSAMLPPNDLEMQPVMEQKPRTRWQQLRPFVYMAAMFAGIWCMMKMFTMMQTTQNGISQPVATESYTLAASTTIPDEYYDYIWSDYNESDLLEDLYDAGYDASSLTF